MVLEGGKPRSTWSLLAALMAIVPCGAVALVAPDWMSCWTRAVVAAEGVLTVCA